MVSRNLNVLTKTYCQLFIYETFFKFTLSSVGFCHPLFMISGPVFCSSGN